MKDRWLKTQATHEELRQREAGLYGVPIELPEPDLAPLRAAAPVPPVPSPLRLRAAQLQWWAP